MSDVSVGIEWQGNNQAWFTANAAVVFPADITIFCNEAPNYGQYKYTDGVTALSSLSWMAGSGGGGSSILDISSIRYSSKYYSLPYSGNLSTALAGYVGAVYMFPVPIGQDHSISALRFKVTVPVASSTIRIGLWEDNGSGLPGTLLLDSGTIPTDTSGDKTYVFPSNISLTGKMFFYGIICSDNISLLGTNNPVPLLQRASGSDAAPSGVACNPPLASNPSLYPVTHYNTPLVEFLKV